MVSVDSFRKMALKLKGVTEEPYFEMTSFRVGKKVLITFREERKRICIKLTPEDQDLFSLHDKTAIHAVPNKWGKLGWTFIELPKVRTEVMRDVLEAAYSNFSKKSVKKGG